MICLSYDELNVLIAEAIFEKFENPNFSISSYLKERGYEPEISVDECVARSIDNAYTPCRNA